MTKKIKIGRIYIGGGEKIAVQSMCNIKTEKADEVILQIKALEALGCDIIRVSVKDQADAKAIRKIKDRINIPLVADIHFDYKLAIAALENGADKIRINPGNIGLEGGVKAVADALKAHKAACRVGSNSGSVEKSFLQKYGKNEISLAESALEKVALLEKYGFYDIVISAKSSSVATTVKTYRYLSGKTGYPLHVGVTEAGTLQSGIIKGSAGIGALLLDGIGDTVRYSLSAPPEEEVKAGVKLLRAVGLDKNYAEVIACPTCGRTAYDCMGLAAATEDYVANVKKPLKIAVMGCVVNGPGEAADCDLGIAGNGEECVIFKFGKPFKKVAATNAKEEFFKEIDLICGKNAKIKGKTNERIY